MVIAFIHENGIDNPLLLLETFGSIGADQHVRKGAELGIKK